MRILCLHPLSGFARATSLLAWTLAPLLIMSPSQSVAQDPKNSPPSVDALVKSIGSADKDKALSSLEQMATAGSAQAALAIGDLFASGKDVPKDLVKALKFYEIAYEKGETSAAGKLGDIYYRNGQSLGLERAQALNFYEKSVDGGNAWAMVSLGDVYREGIIVPVDFKKALELYNRALEKGNKSVVTKLGDLYYKNADTLGVDGKKALDYYAEGIKDGNPWAMASLGDVYREGKLVPADLRKALDLYSSAFEKGNTAAAIKLGDLYYKNAEELDLDATKAINYYEMAAKDGNPWAIASLGDVYREGMIVPVDLPKALSLYQASLEKGNTAVAIKIGDLYYKSADALGVDQKNALEYYQKAADEGNARALASLGDIYREGKITNKDLAKALTLYSESLAKGNAAVGIKLGDLYYRDGKALGLPPEKALDYYNQGASEGNPWAMASLADVYRDGRIVPKDLRKALELYTDALAKGNMSVVGRLGILYYRNSGELKVDPTKAIEFFQMGADSGDAWAAASLADIYREGKIVPINTMKASELYQKSYKGGNNSAYLAEINMLLRGTAPLQKRGVAMISAGLKQKIPAIIPVWADANLFGRGVPRDPQKGLAILKNGASSGDIPATLRLAALYIQGYGKAIPRNAAAATKLLKSLEGKVENERMDAERLYMAGTFAASKTQFSAFMDQFRALSPSAKASLAGRISWANQNTFVYVIQDYLKQQGLYNGPTNGQLTGPTSRAMNSVCEKIAPSKSICGEGPLSEKVRPLLSEYLKNDGSQS